MDREKIRKILSGSLKGEDISGSSNGIGLDNVINRLKLFTDCGDCSDVFDILSEGENMGTEVRIYLPFMEKEYEDV